MKIEQRKANLDKKEAASADGLFREGSRFFITEDQTLKKEWFPDPEKEKAVNRSTLLWSMRNLFVCLGLLYLTRFHQEYYLFVGLGVLAAQCWILKAKAALMTEKAYRRNTWNQLLHYDQVVKGVRCFLEQCFGHCACLIPIKEGDYIARIFDFEYQSFLFLADNKVCTIRVKRSSLSPSERGGWDMTAKPCQEVCSYEAFYQIPDEVNSIRFCIETFGRYLRQKKGHGVSISPFQNFGPKVRVWDSLEGGYRCLCLTDDRDNQIMVITHDDRWDELVSLWNMAF